MLFPPTSERAPAEWAAVAAGHAFVGVMFAVLCLWLGWSVWVGPMAYLVAWEVIRQRLGAGWADAITDAAFVALGAHIGWALDAQASGAAMVACGAALAGIGFGVWRRL